MGATKIVTDATFADDVLLSDKPVLVDFWAEWCGPCKMVSPILEEIADAHADKITIVKLNVDENPQIAAAERIMSIPTHERLPGRPRRQADRRRQAQGRAPRRPRRVPVSRVTPPAYRRGDTGAGGRGDPRPPRPARAPAGGAGTGRPGTTPPPPCFDDAVDRGGPRLPAGARSHRRRRRRRPQTFRRLEEARWALGDRVLSYSPGHLVAGDDVARAAAAALRPRLRPRPRRRRLRRARPTPPCASSSAAWASTPTAPAARTPSARMERLRPHDERRRAAARQPLRELHALETLLQRRRRQGRRHRPRSRRRRHRASSHGELTEAVIAGDLATRVEGRLAAIGVQVLLTRSPEGDRGARGGRARALRQRRPPPISCVSLHADSVDSAAPAGLRDLLLRRRRRRHRLGAGRAVRRDGAGRDLRAHRPHRLPHPRQDLGPAADDAHARRARRVRLPLEPARRAAPGRPGLPRRRRRGHRRRGRALLRPRRPPRSAPSASSSGPRGAARPPGGVRPSSRSSAASTTSSRHAHGRAQVEAQPRRAAGAGARW